MQEIYEYIVAMISEKESCIHDLYNKSIKDENSIIEEMMLKRELIVLYKIIDVITKI